MGTISPERGCTCQCGRLGLTHMCAFSRIPHSVHRPPVSRLTLMARDCLLAWHPSLGTALPGQARRMLLASYVLGNRCDSWLFALWHGFALRQHMAGGPSHWRLCLPHATWSLWPSPGQPCPSLAHHLSLFAAHAFTLAFVWPVGIGPHVCLVANPSSCASFGCALPWYAAWSVSAA